ncbi:hypothetical protein Ddc_00288 [Ditylenchus destructor]|nr:hypothetical protein Ddc_00288 [Ditylenchus destructor]
MGLRKVMPSGNPENPGFGQVTDFQSRLLFGRVIYQTIALNETNTLANFQDQQMGLREVMAFGDPENPGFRAGPPSQKNDFGRAPRRRPRESYGISA